MGQVWHWLWSVLAWHKANVLGNVVATLEMSPLAVLAGRPIYRRARDRFRAHLVAEMREHIVSRHEHTELAIARLLGVDPADPDGDGVAGVPERDGGKGEG